MLRLMLVLLLWDVASIADKLSDGHLCRAQKLTIHVRYLLLTARAVSLLVRWHFLPMHIMWLVLRYNSGLRCGVHTWPVRNLTQVLMLLQIEGRTVRLLFGATWCPLTLIRLALGALFSLGLPIRPVWGSRQITIWIYGLMIRIILVLRPWSHCSMGLLYLLLLLEHAFGKRTCVVRSHVLCAYASLELRWSKLVRIQACEIWIYLSQAILWASTLFRGVLAAFRGTSDIVLLLLDFH